MLSDKGRDDVECCQGEEGRRLAAFETYSVVFRIDQR